MTKLKERINSPNITLCPVWDGEIGNSAVKLICTLSGYFPDTLTVEWQQEGETLASQQQTQTKLQSVAAKEETFSLSSEIKPNMEEWEKGSRFTCKSNHNNTDFKETISICNFHWRTRPSVQVEIPSLKTVMTTSTVEAVCVVQSAYRAKVTWLKDQTEAATKDLENKENGTHIISKLKVPSSYWKQLKSVTCKAEHLCFSTMEKTVPVSGVVTSPSVEIRRLLTGLQQGDVVLLCNVTTLSSTDLYITFQDSKGAGSEEHYVSLPEASGLHSVTREWSVNTLSGMKDRSFTCTVNQGFTGFKSKSISFDAEPSVDLFAPGKESGPQRLLCSGSGINPQIQWLSGSQNLTSTSNISMGADGRVTVSSQLPILETEWKAGKNFTCEVSDKSVNKHTRETISFCSVLPTSSQFVSVYVHGPRAEELLKDEQVTITCLLVGLGLKDFSITWKVNGINQHANISTEQPVSHSNGTETVQSFFNISTKDWDAFKEVSCEGKHICSKQSYKDHIRKNTVIYSKPSATLLQGSHELVCLATGYSPSSINITWFVKNSKEPIYYTTEPHAATNGTFSIQSHLNLSQNRWLPGDMIICNVTHENTTLSLNVTKSDTLEKCLFLDEILQAEVYQDISVDSWYTTVTFLLLFLTAVFYSVGVTMVKTK